LTPPYSLSLAKAANIARAFIVSIHRFAFLLTPGFAGRRRALRLSISRLIRITMVIPPI